jgi:hypothetical protein
LTPPIVAHIDLPASSRQSSTEEESKLKKNLTALLVCCTVVSALAAYAEEYPHAFPRTGVTKLFDNERVTAWEVHWKRDIPQPIHRHQFDMAGVYLRYGPIRVTSPEGAVSPQRPAFDVPRPYFQSKGVTHREEMIGFAPDAPERLAVMFDLKEISVAPVEAAGIPKAFPREGAVKAIDNDRVTEWDYTWIPGRKVDTHSHERDSVQVFFAGGTIRFTSRDGKVETKTFKFGDTRFIPRGTVDAEEAITGSPRAVTIELK